MSPEMTTMLIESCLQTIYMVLVSGVIAAIIGTPIGLLLFTTKKHGVLSNWISHQTLSIIVDVIRSFPFIILMVAIIPLTRLIAGTSIGTTAAIIPLTIGAIPFYARIVANALNELPKGLLEASLAMGASPFQIMHKVLLPESMPALIHGFTLTLVTLVGYSAMAGTVGGGGLGDLAIRYGYQRFDVHVMIATVVILIILVQIIQIAGDFIAKQCDKS